MKTANTPITSNNSIASASPEVRAFIYQQLTDLEDLLPVGSNVSILVEDPNLLPTSQKAQSKKKGKKKAHKKRVIIQLDTTVGDLVVENENFDVYQAIRGAKEELRGQLTTLQSFLDPMDRDQKIEDIVSNKLLH